VAVLTNEFTALQTMHTPVNSELIDAPAEPGESLLPTSAMPVRNIAFVLLSIAIVVLLLRFMQPVLLPLVLAALLFYALDPAVDRLHKLHVPRALGAAVMLFIAVTSCGVLAYTLQGQAVTVIDQLPVGARRLAATLRQAPGAEPGAVEKVQQAADEQAKAR
jgi:predicted PurR-regulated permease PerM